MLAAPPATPTPPATPAPSATSAPPATIPQAQENTLNCYFCGLNCHDNHGHLQHMTACWHDWEAPEDIKMLCLKCHLCKRVFSEVLPQGRFLPVDDEAGAECAECFALQ